VEEHHRHIRLHCVVTRVRLIPCWQPIPSASAIPILIAAVTSSKEQLTSVYIEHLVLCEGDSLRQEATSMGQMHMHVNKMYAAIDDMQTTVQVTLLK